MFFNFVDDFDEEMGTLCPIRFADDTTPGKIANILINRRSTN